MEDKDFEKLLKENIHSELCIPDNVDRRTRHQMDRVVKQKNYSLILMLIAINTVLVILFSVYFWILSSTDIQKIAIMLTSISFISLLLCFYVINKQTYLEKEVKI